MSRIAQVLFSGRICEKIRLPLELCHKIEKHAQCVPHLRCTVCTRVLLVHYISNAFLKNLQCSWETIGTNLFVSCGNSVVNVIQPEQLDLTDDSQLILNLNLSGTTIPVQTPIHLRILDRVYNNTIHTYQQLTPYKYVTFNTYLCFECIFRRRKLRRLFLKFFRAIDASRTGSLVS